MIPAASASLQGIGRPTQRLEAATSCPSSENTKSAFKARKHCLAFQELGNAMVVCDAVAHAGGAVMFQGGQKHSPSETVRGPDIHPGRYTVQILLAHDRHGP